MAHILRYSEQEVPKILLDASDTLLLELADEARRYLRLLERLKTAEGEDLEAKLYASISHFKSHSEVTLECLDDLVDHLPDENDEQAAVWRPHE